MLSKAPAARLESLWDAIGIKADYRVLRPAEQGLVMVRGRVGGTGNRFNLGEMTVSRCAVRLVSGETGFSYRAGRSRRAAEIAAVADALLQIPSWNTRLSQQLVAPLLSEQREQRELTARRSAATKVDFFTMTRNRGQK